MMLLMLITLAGCATRTELATLEAELAALRAEHEALEAEVAALKRPRPPPAAANAEPQPLSRAELTAVLEDPEAMAQLARVVPHNGSDGEIDGFRIGGVRRSSLLDRAGFRNGDVIHSINGRPLTSIDGAMETYAALQKEDRFEVVVTRRGQQMTLTVTLTD